MSNKFNFTQLESGEELVFGPVTQTRSTSVSGGGGQMTHTSGRTVGVTNQRVIVEELGKPDQTQIVENANISQVQVKRQNRQGKEMIALVSVRTESGENIKLDIKWLPSETEEKLRETFPKAEIAASKGGGISKVVIIIAAVIFFLACVVPVLILIGGRLFAN